jgi:hypothetical protein
MQVLQHYCAHALIVAYALVATRMGSRARVPAPSFGLRPGTRARRRASCIYVFNANLRCTFRGPSGQTWGLFLFGACAVPFLLSRACAC